ncbi:MAG: hypothetical protein F6K39_10755 [Okeania sp. SIO3B3]|nr:hypothetical protein [Okeania sp. SIO3B3]
MSVVMTIGEFFYVQLTGFDITTISNLVGNDDHYPLQMVYNLIFCVSPVKVKLIYIFLGELDYTFFRLKSSIILYKYRKHFLRTAAQTAISGQLFRLSCCANSFLIDMSRKEEVGSRGKELIIAVG